MQEGGVIIIIYCVVLSSSSDSTVAFDPKLKQEKVDGVCR